MWVVALCVLGLRGEMFSMRVCFVYMFTCATWFFCHRDIEERTPVIETLKSKSVLKKAFSTSSIPNKVGSSSSVAVEDIDKDDNGDPFLLPEYVNDIYVYLREVEVSE
jgi:hypothetical protein